MNNKNGICVCDKCHKFILKQWTGFQLVKRRYLPGEKFDICSSDIRMRQTKMMDLCPECMREVEEMLGMGVD